MRRVVPAPPQPTKGTCQREPGQRRDRAQRRARADGRRGHRLELGAPRRLRGRRAGAPPRSSTRRSCAASAARSARPAASARRLSSWHSRRWAASRPSPASSASRTCWAIATAACRDASDGPDFISRGEKALGTRIQVLSGQREAELAANGIMMGFRSPDGIAGDLGGGSLELIGVEGETLRRSATLPLGGLRLLDAAEGRIERGDRHRRRGDRARALARRGPQPRLLRGRRHLARHCPPAHGADGLSAARHARLHDADRGGDRVLRGDPQGQEALLHARHGGALQAAPRGAALRRAGARAALEAPLAQRRRLLGVRHPRGPGLQPAVGDRAQEGPAAVLLRSSTRASAPVPPSTPRSCAPGPTPCSTGRGRRRRTRSAACAMPPACSPTSAGARIPTTAASRA